MRKKIKIELERISKFSPFGILKLEYKKAKDKVQFLKEYRESLEETHGEQTNKVFISNIEFLFKRI